jgi:hypothetical protein
LTPEVAFPLYDTIRSFGAQLYVDGHSEAPISPAELEAEQEKLRLAEALVREGVGDRAPDDLREYVDAFVIGSSARS